MFGPFFKVVWTNDIGMQQVAVCTEATVAGKLREIVEDGGVLTGITPVPATDIWI